MKKTKILSIAALALMMTACSNDVDLNTPQSANDSKGIPFTATVATDRDAATRALSYTESENKLEFVWLVGEKMALVYTVGGQSYNSTATVTAVDAETGAATISATLNEGVDNGTKLTIIYPETAADGTTGNIKSGLLAEQDGMLNNPEGVFLDVRKGTGIVSVAGGQAYLGSSTKLKAQYAICKFSLGIILDAEHPLYIRDGKNAMITTVKPASSANQLFVAMAPATDKVFAFKATNATNRIRKKGNAALKAGKFYQTELPSLYPMPMADVEDEDVGCIIANDAKVYMTPATAKSAGKTPEAMIAFVGSVECNNGIALALRDCDAGGSYGAGTYYWSRAGNFEEEGKPIPHWRKNHPIEGGEWRMPSKQDWQLMFLGCRYETDMIARADIMEPINGFKDKLKAAGASLSTEYGEIYWISDGEGKYYVRFENEGNYKAIFENDGFYNTMPLYTRACLAF